MKQGSLDILKRNYLILYIIYNSLHGDTAVLKLHNRTRILVKLKELNPSETGFAGSFAPPRAHACASWTLANDT